ncbi:MULTISPECIES: imm11 family protein [Leisingera]|mgnify:CR=1 FL=1|uniref:imm11 family protein n=1 Tax=Leisingera TaxID=191028 RepID=UPI00048604DC|nr:MULTISPECIES: DUF1629 domain-containing protein [Leisingera]
MAKVLRESSDPKFYGKFRLELCDPADQLRVQAGKDWLKAEEMAALEETHDGYLIEFRRSERPWRAEFLPQKLCMTKGKELPDYTKSIPGCKNEYSHGSLVSSKLKSVIENHQSEHDGWLFSPVEILNKDGSVHGTRYIWWVHKVVDAIDPTSEGIKTVGGPVDGKHRWTHIGKKSSTSKVAEIRGQRPNSLARFAILFRA